MFNASVYMWQIVRPYQRSGHRQIIARPLANVVKALDDVNEQDYKWRLELMMSVILYTCTLSYNFMNFGDIRENKIGKFPQLQCLVGTSRSNLTIVSTNVNILLMSTS